MKLNKRTFAVAALSVSLVVPTISPAAHAQEKHLNCSNGVEKGVDFDAETVEAHVAEYLQRSCKLTGFEIGNLSDSELRAVARELGYDDSALNIGFLRAMLASKDSPTGAEEDLQWATITVDEAKAGAKKISGRVHLPAGQDQQKISVTFLPRVHTEHTLVSRQNADNAGWVNFELAVPESLVLNAGDMILAGIVPADHPKQKKTILVMPSESPEDMMPDPELPVPMPNPGGGSDNEESEQTPPASTYKPHLGCNQKFRKGADFDGVPSVVVVEHLQRNCGLSDDEIRKLSEEDLRKVAKELNEPADKVKSSSVRAVFSAKTGAPVPEPKAEPQPAPPRVTEKERQDALQKLAASSAINPEQRKAFTKDIEDASDVERLQSIKQAIEAENSNPIGKLVPKKSLKPQAPKQNPESNNEDPTKKPNPKKESGKLNFEDNEVFSPNQKEWTAKDFVNPFKQHEKNEAGQELQETKRAASAAIDGIPNLSDEHKAAYKEVIASATSIEQIELLVHGALETSDNAAANDKPTGPFGLDENPLYSPNEKQWTSEDFLNSFKQHEKNEAAKIAEQTMLKDAKRQAHATIDGIKGLTEKHRTDFKAQIDAATNQEAVQRIVEVAQKASTTDADDAAENQPPKNGGNSGGTDNGNSTGERENTPGSSESKAKGIAAIAAGFGALGLAIGGILSAVNYFGGLNTIQAKVIDMLTSIGIRF
ncbi:GA module-containing protein [Corynebacterium propinquum]|uniref:GA module-containing protein n=1 Tax=Corynebacterium propinquum TaxID=43769 RepID=UPI001EF1FE2A|nr:GA module-containing protein [Corynebacterium propinquum]MCG7230617.1 hypothetical protein [Corynebacterium propinquum]MDK4238214.1 GA module-containing protein [Corynebacterium propinquum]